MVRNEPKSVRRPLRDLPNANRSSQINSHNGGGGGGRVSKSMKVSKKLISNSKKELENQHMAAAVHQEEGGGGEEEDEGYLDRLLLVQSDLSSFTRQIDELVAQAFTMKPPSKQGKREIESFSLVLSDMLLSLKPWVPRFQKVLSCPSSENKNQLAPSMTDTKVSAVNENEIFEVESPEHTTMNSLISPSPLVSWRAEGNIGRGRQLFLLTPLSLSKTLSSKRRNLYKSAHESIVSNPAVEIPSFLAVSSDVNDDSPEGIAINPTPNKPSASVVKKAKTAQNFKSVSSPTFSRNDNPIFVTTPCLKMSPPKSCLVLEPISVTSHKGKAIARKSTPFPVGIHTQNSESSSGSEDSDGLALKYPELLGIQWAYKSRMGKKDLEASPNWSFSPPKTCVLLEPSDEKPLDSSVTDNDLPISVPVFNQKKELILSEECNDQGGSNQIKKPCGKETTGGNYLTLIESTPAWKEPESSMRIGKRPGENTLKKELWTKFEAASAYAFHLDVSAFPKTAQKGFLDMLDEVSLDGENADDDGLR
ncbi:uncharacterized protein [Euphorbia lathyris]|uniref:uncharacterized protein n=1 Tax=Euphorbia lathyris TaxID=212925 RepID=UPI0033140F56